MTEARDDPFEIIVGKGWLVIARTRAVETGSGAERYPDALTTLPCVDRDEVLDTFEAEWPVELLSRRNEILAFLDGEALEIRLQD